jgi:DNA-binding PadR family transcriptional regulator
MPRRKPQSFLPLKSHWFHILLSLVPGEQHGYGIMRDVLAHTDGRVRLWPATLYGSLKRLIQEGLIAESGDRPAPELDDARRRYYRITPLGQQVLELESERLQTLVKMLHAKRKEAAS